MSNQLGEVRVTVTVKTNKPASEVTQHLVDALDAEHGFQNISWETPPSRQEIKCTVV